MTTLTRFKKNDAVAITDVNANFTALNAVTITERNLADSCAIPNNLLAQTKTEIVLGGQQVATSFDALNDEMVLGCLSGEVSRDVTYTITHAAIGGDHDAAGGATDGTIGLEYLVLQSGPPSSGTWTSLTTFASVTTGTQISSSIGTSITVPKQQSMMFRLRVTAAPTSPYTAGRVLGSMRALREITRL